MDGVAVDVERGDAGGRDDHDVAVGVGHEPPDQRGLAGARLAGQKQVAASDEEVQRVTELVGEDDPGHGRTVARAARKPDCCTGDVRFR